MTAPAFTLKLGNGLYLDSEGNLLQGPVPNTPTYKAPFSLPVDVQKIRSALSEVESALKDINKRGVLHDRWGKVDEVDKILDLLSGISKLAAALAPVASVLSFAIEAAKLFGLLKEGPSALEGLVVKRFNELEQRVTAIAQQIQTNDLRDGRLAIENLVNHVKAYVDQLEQANPNLQQLEADRVTLNAAYAAHIDQFSKFFDQQTWFSNFKRSEHSTVWAWDYALFTMPGSAVTDAIPAKLPPDGPNFDHRLMVPLAAYAAENYLIAIRGMSPEYRTSGDFRGDIRNFAGKLANLAQLMREKVLARTIYKPEYFSLPLVSNYEVVHSGPLGVFTSISPTCGRWPVGAIDLRYHDDAYFSDFLGELWMNEALSRPGPTKFGCIDLRWIPPAVLELSDFGNYKITNPQECADAANAQSEKDYADLLAMSGYFELIRLATLLRNEATEPSKSQTVKAKAPVLFRNPLPAIDVTVQSNPVKYTGQVITSRARREPQECMDRVNVWTQPIKRARPVEYQIKLRTLASLMSKDDWSEPIYSDYQRVDYEPDPNHSGFLRLALSTSTEVASHALVSAWTASPRKGSIHLSDTVDMLAHTFDWWIPVPEPYTIDIPFDVTLAELRGSGWKAAFEGAPTGFGTVLGYGGMNVMTAFEPLDEPGSYISNYPELFWKPGKQDWDGHHRAIRKETVRIEYEFDWTADRIQFSIKNRPSDRNYIVFLVIEEKMQASTNVLHTAAALPVNGQLTYVPKTFFDEEFKAHAQTASIIASLIPKYIPTVDDIGRNPIVGWVHPASLATRTGVNRILDWAKEHQPDLFHQIVTEVAALGQK